MPELPEVETVRRGLVPVFEEDVFERIVVNRSDLRVRIPADFVERFTGQRVLSPLVRRGKYLIIRCDGGDGFVLHLGMSGSIRIYQPCEVYEPLTHDHAVFEMRRGAVVVLNDPRRFGMLYSVRADTWESERPFCAMGPEPLGNGFDGVALYGALMRKRASIKAALLDQRVVAGLGNIYVCEALYRCGIHPARLACNVSVDEAADLAVYIRAVLREAIASGGSSLRDHKLTDGSLAYFQHHFDVYDRKGEVCGACSSAGLEEPCVERIVQSGRSSFFCSRTQK